MEILGDTMIEDKGMWEKLSVEANATHEKVNLYISQAKEYFKDNQYEESLTKLQDCLSLDPDNLEVHYLLGLIYTKQKDLNKAIMHLNEIALSRYQYLHLNHVYQLLAYIYTLQNDYETAKEHIDSLLKEHNDDLKALSFLGYIHYINKDYDSAIEVYSKVIGIDANNANAYNSLAMIHIDSGEDIEKGITLCKKALEIQPHTPAYLDTLGLAYYKLNDEESAMSYLKEAYELDPDNEQIKEHLKLILNI